jgi:hypothetical protein
VSAKRTLVTYDGADGLRNCPARLAKLDVACTGVPTFFEDVLHPLKTSHSQLPYEETVRENWRRFGSEAWTRTRINGVRVRCATNCTTSEQFFRFVVFHFFDSFVQV